MSDRSDHPNLCVLRVSTDVLDLPGVVIADRNAASSYVSFGPVASALGSIDYKLVFAESWTYPEDQAKERSHKAIKCAEVLVPDRVDSDYVFGAYVSGVTSRARSQRSRRRSKQPSMPTCFSISRATAMVEDVLVGDPFDSQAQTLVNTVNCVGVMGKGNRAGVQEAVPGDVQGLREARCQGAPSETRQALSLFPEWHRAPPMAPYPSAGNFPTQLSLSPRTGQTPEQPRILNFPTKKHWRSKSSPPTDISL